MPFYHVVLLVVALLVSGANSTSEPKTSRYLRAFTTEVDDSEDRGISVNLPGLEKISNAFTSTKTKELQKLIKAGESTGDSFKSLGFGKALSFEQGVRTKMVSKFLSGDKFKAWSKYTKLNQKHPDEAMLTAFTSAYGEKNTAVIILLGKDALRSRAAAKRLETAQFNKWYTQDGLTNADELVKQVLKVPRNKLRGYPREMSIWDNYSKYISKVVMHPRPGPL
ncbi:hypothetical protein P3T76_013394 [Phytophthora citrophthora]|uniref:RxLR effector protein n=1 Tax=Phytophthora citrophthora TaxID=4793 RepID=A0AAD9LCD0_9STRA|nr:hypothetical protein P3T76_013394 [Phytophthora citrophthora]